LPRSHPDQPLSVLRRLPRNGMDRGIWKQGTHSMSTRLEDTATGADSAYNGGEADRRNATSTPAAWVTMTAMNAAPKS
jgi:hypothetical protein